MTIYRHIVGNTSDPHCFCFCFFPFFFPSSSPLLQVAAQIRVLKLNMWWDIPELNMWWDIPGIVCLHVVPDLQAVQQLIPGAYTHTYIYVYMNTPWFSSLYHVYIHMRIYTCIHICMFTCSTPVPRPHFCPINLSFGPSESFATTCVEDEEYAGSVVAGSIKCPSLL